MKIKITKRYLDKNFDKDKIIDYLENVRDQYRNDEISINKAKTLNNTINTLYHRTVSAEKDNGGQK